MRNREPKIVSYYKVTLYYDSKPKESFDRVNYNVYIKENTDGTKRISFDRANGEHVYRNGVRNYTIDQYTVEV